MPEQFFAKQLQGEKPLSGKVAKELCERAASFFERHPWKQMDESQLVFVRRPGGDLHTLSVMGALGEVLCLIDYCGIEGYHFFEKLRSASTLTIGEFYSDQHSISVTYEKRTGVKALDREVLRATGYSSQKGSLAPVFRTVRPGYHPWYVTDEEGQILSDCLAAMLFFINLDPDLDQAAWWNTKGHYPLLSFQGVSGQGDPEFGVGLFAPPAEVAAMPKPAGVDAARVQKILGRKSAPAGVLQVDHFYGGAQIGQANERKACLRMVMVVDGKSGMAYPPELAGPDAETGEMLEQAILRALETNAPVPREIHVRDQRQRALVEPLAEALGAKAVVKKSLPALDFARDSILEMMGESGSIRVR